MSKKNEENALLVKGVFCDAYKYYLSYHGKPAEPGMWESATKDFSDIMKRYQDADICGRIMLAVFWQLQEEMG